MNRQFRRTLVDGIPAVILEAAINEEEQEHKTEDGVKITQGGSLYEKLAAPSRTLLDRSIAEHEPSEVSIVPKGNEVDVVLTKDGEPIVAATLPTTDSERTLINELAYTLRPPRTGKPEGIDDREWERRQDAVRDAAREFDFMEEGDARQFLSGRAANPDVVDYGAFIRDVQEQRLDDLADILDQDVRKKDSSLALGRRRVRLMAPKNWVTRVFAKLDDEDLLTLARRLERRGWGMATIEKHLFGRIKDDEKRESLLIRYEEASA